MTSDAPPYRDARNCEMLVLVTLRNAFAVDGDRSYCSSLTLMDSRRRIARRRRTRLHAPAAPTSAQPPASALTEGELPELQTAPRLVLLVVNPYLVFVYWDLNLSRLSPSDLQSALLRFYDMTPGQTPTSFDVTVDLHAKNWYVHLWSPEKLYCVEIGVQRADIFVPLARSNTVQTPRAWPVADVAEQFAPAPPPPEAGPPQLTPSPRELNGLPAAPIPVLTASAQADPAEPAAELHSTPPQPSPRPPGAAEVLQNRLTELLALRASPDIPAAAPPRSEPVSLPSAPQEAPRNLTTHAEQQFTPGVSSPFAAAPSSKKASG